MPSEADSFGPFEFNAIRRELRKRGTPIKLDPQAAQLLALLLEEPGKLFSYEEIQVCLWGKTVVDYDKGIRRCLSQIRGVLNDNAKTPVYIQVPSAIADAGLLLRSGCFPRTRMSG